MYNLFMEYQKELTNLWQQVSKNQLFKSKNLLRDLFLLFKYDLRLIHKHRLNFTFDPEKIPDCQNCKNNCCHGAENTVSLRLTDIARLLDNDLSQAIDMDNQAFLNDIYFAIHKKDKNIISKSDDWRFFPVLKRIDNVCPYLDENKKCTIYKHRPITCRRFPYIIEHNKKTLTYSNRCQQFKLEDNPAKQGELLQATVDSYNEKVKDLILINYALPELHKIDLGQYVKMKK